MYDIQLSEHNIVIEKSKHLGVIGDFVQQNCSKGTYPHAKTTVRRVRHWAAMPAIAEVLY